VSDHIDTARVRSTVLAVEHISKHFGGIAALTDVSFEMREQEILGLIGPNGAGKTTLFSVISGFYRPDQGRIDHAGTDITGWPPHRIAQRGLMRTFQVPRLFDEMTVYENVRIACHLLARAHPVAAIVGGRRYRAERETAEKRTTEVLTTFGMQKIARMQCLDLAHGQKRLLSVAVALASSPRLLLLDEPLSGLTDEEVERMLGVCRSARGAGVSVLIVEHNVREVLGLCDRVVVLDFGRVIADGPPTDIERDLAVIRAYLGEPVRRADEPYVNPGEGTG
jgi:branched-chain amino acid transport system ATP-binding protein